VHPQHNTRADWGWIPTGKDFKVPANLGRARFNLNGALNAHAPTEGIIQDAQNFNLQTLNFPYLWPLFEHDKGKTKTQS
jgi:hypothetical protein